MQKKSQHGKTKAEILAESRMLAARCLELYETNQYTNAQIGEMLGISAAQVGRKISSLLNMKGKDGRLDRDRPYVNTRRQPERLREELTSANRQADAGVKHVGSLRRYVGDLEATIATKDRLMARGAAEAAAALAAKDEEIAALKAENERLKARVAELEAAPVVDAAEVAEPQDVRERGEVVAEAAPDEQTDRRDEWREYVRECMANRRNPLRYDLWLEEAEPAAEPPDERAELENELRAYGGEWNEALRAWVYGRYIPRDLLSKAAAFHGVAAGNVFETTVFRELADAKRARNGGEVVEMSWGG